MRTLPFVISCASCPTHTQFLIVLFFVRELSEAFPLFSFSNLMFSPHCPDQVYMPMYVRACVYVRNHKYHLPQSQAVSGWTHICSLHRSKTHSQDSQKRHRKKYVNWKWKSPQIENQTYTHKCQKILTLKQCLNERAHILIPRFDLLPSMKLLLHLPYASAAQAATAVAIFEW